MDTSREIITWFLQGPAWLKFAVEKQLLDVSSDPEIAANDSAILKLIKRLNSRISASIVSGRESISPVFQRKHRRANRPVNHANLWALARYRAHLKDD
jgi:hypothetical protein